MAPTESEILTNFLLRPTSLDTIVTYEWFTSNLPTAVRDNLLVRALWQDLIAKREKVLDEVRANIEGELKRGAVMRREVLRAKREAEKEDIDGEVELERMLFGDKSGAKKAKHSLQSIIPELDGARATVETEIEKLQAEEAILMDSVKQTVGGLSDLRYGKFANGKIKDEILDGLTGLEEVCEQKM